MAPISRRKTYRNLHLKKKPIALLHIAKIAMFKLRHEPWNGAALPSDYFSRSTERFEILDLAKWEDYHGEQPLVSVIGHSTVLIKLGGLTFLTDPVWSNVAGPFNIIGPKRRTPPPITLEDLPHIDCVLLSHDHYDHLDKKALKFLMERDEPRILTGLGVGRHIKGYDQLYELNWHQSVELGDLTVYFCPAQHFSGRSIFFNKSLWGGFLISGSNANVYFPGDTGYNESMFQDIKKTYGPIDLGIIPIGAYKPYNALKPYHMSPNDAVRLHELLDLQASIAVHFGTYQLSIESINSQIADFAEVWEEHRGRIAGEFILPDFGAGYCVKLDDRSNYIESTSSS